MRRFLLSAVLILGLLTPLAMTARAATFPINYSDPASDVVRLNSTTGLCEVDAADNCIMSPNPQDVNIQWVRGRDVAGEYNLTIEVRGRIQDYPNTTYAVNLYIDATNQTHWIVNYTDGGLSLTTNQSGTAVVDITGNATVYGPNPTSPNIVSMFVNQSLLGGPSNISASVNIDGMAIQKGDPNLGEPYSYQDFGWEVSGHPATSPTLLNGHVYVRGTTTPIAGATVGLSDGQSVQTNATGYYAFSLTPGTYNVTVTADGFVAVTVSVTLTLGETVTRDIELERASLTPLGDLLLPAVIALAVILAILLLVALAKRRRKRPAPDENRQEVT